MIVQKVWLPIPVEQNLTWLLQGTTHLLTSSLFYDFYIYTLQTGNNGLAQKIIAVLK